MVESTGQTPLLTRVQVVAEIGVNHDGDVAQACDLVEKAADSGADSAKFQIFLGPDLLSNQAGLARYQRGADADLHAMLGRLELALDQLKQVRQRARQRGIGFIVTPFSLADVARVAELEVDQVKIASPDVVNTPLIEAAATLGQPMLISTGAATLEEIAPAADLLRRHAAGGALLHCVSSYPTPTDAAALAGIRVIGDRFKLPVGYSDHTQSLHTGALAVAAGAMVIEKHLTHDTAAPGPDHAVSFDPPRFTDYVRRIREAESMLGPATKAVSEHEREVRQLSRQSLCAARDLKAGHVLQREDLCIKRPGTGIPAAMLDATIGRRLARDVRGNDLLTNDDLAV